MKIKHYIFLAALLALSPVLWAATSSFDFDDAANYTFDSSVIEVNSGVASLVERTDQVDDDNDANGFGGGTHNGTQWDNDNHWIEFDGVSNTHALPDNGGVTSWADMNSNALLLHFDDTDDSGTFVDSSGLGNNATCVDTACPVEGVEGMFETAVDFDGANDSVSAEIADGFDPDATDFSVEAWVNFTTLDNGDHQVIVSQNDGTGTGANWLYLDDDSDTIVTFLGENLIDTGFTPTVGEWTHVVLTSSVDSGVATLTLYVNGIERARSTGVDITSATGALVFGSNKSATGQFLFGSLDEVAFYTRTLSASEVDYHYFILSGDFMSRVFDAGASAPWTSLSWRTNRPTHKPLPDNAQSETAYAAGNVDMTGNLVLYHFDEANGSTDFADASGNNNTAHCTGAQCPTAGASGAFGASVQFDGANQFVTTPDGVFDPTTTDFTVSAWVNFSALDNDGADQVLIAQAAGTGTGDRNWLYIESDTQTLTTDIGGAPQDTEYTIAAGWHHIAITKDSENVLIYVDSEEVTSFGAEAFESANGSFFFGTDASGNSGFNGRFDEFALFTRTFSPADVVNLYTRGALRLKFQVRSCDDAACDTENFIGPDGTSNTFYTGDTSTGTFPSVTLSGVADNRYFQYRAYFESDNFDFSPELTRVEVGPHRFSSESPSISNNDPVSFETFNAIAQTLGANNQGNVTYQLSTDNTTWYFVNDGDWTVATGTQSSSVDDINANAASFDDDVGTGNLFFRAFLNSNGSQEVELDTVTLDTSDQDDGNNGNDDDGNPSENPNDGDNVGDGDGSVNNPADGGDDSGCSCYLGQAPLGSQDPYTLLMSLLMSAPVLGLRVRASRKRK